MTTTVRLFFTGKETTLARKYSKLPTSRNPTEADMLWVPRSITEHTTKQPMFPGEMQEHHLKLPDWFVHNNGL